MLTEEQLFLVEANQKELVWNIKTELIAEAHGHGNGIVIFLMQEYEGQESVSLEVDASSRHEIENWLNAIASEFN